MRVISHPLLRQRLGYRPHPPAVPGTRTSPDIRLARLVRAAITVPVFMQPVKIDGVTVGDGDIINIFPVDPLVQNHPEIDFFIGINSFYPENFDGEDHSGWQSKTFSVFRVSHSPVTASISRRPACNSG